MSPTIPGCALEGTGHAYNRSTKELGKALGLETHRARQLELLRRDGGQEYRPQTADLSVGAQSLDRREDGLRHRHGAVQRLLSQPEKGGIRPRQRRRLARGQRPTVAQGRTRDLRGRQGRDHPRARLDQGSDRRGGPESAGEELAQGSQGRQLLRLHVHAAAPHLSGEGQGAGLGVDIEAAFHGRSAGGGRRRECRISAQDRVLRRRPHALRQRHLDQAGAQSLDHGGSLRRRCHRHRMSDLPHRSRDASGPRRESARPQDHA